MRKLALDLNDLRVDSFATAPEMKDVRGTVNGHLVGVPVPESQLCISQACEPWTQNPSDAHCTHTHIAAQ
ncbi:MAG TPA: hypothetical protein VF625_07180 [Longimicrobium sp.]|jgi:hypothetical protein